MKLTRDESWFSTISWDLVIIAHIGTVKYFKGVEMFAEKVVPNVGVVFEFPFKI